MSWTSVVESIIAGIVTALIWVAILYAANLARHRKIRRSLQKVFESPGWSLRIDGFGITVRNTSNVNVTIRKVQLFENYPGKYVSLNYAGPTRDVIDHRPKDLKEQTEIEFQHRRKIEQDERGFVTLPPQCGGTWSVSNEALLNTPAAISAIQAVGLVLDYRSVIGSTAVLFVKAQDEITKDINEAFLRYRQEVPRLAKIPLPR